MLTIQNKFQTGPGAGLQSGKWQRLMNSENACSPQEMYLEKYFTDHLLYSVKFNNTQRFTRLAKLNVCISRLPSDSSE